MKTFCEYFDAGTCRSCSLIEVDYTTQITHKVQILKSFLPLNCIILPPIESKKSSFRNKAKFTVTGSIDSPIIGLSGIDNLDEGREILNCPLHHPKINEVISKISSFIKTANLTPYQIKEKKGELKGLILYHSEGSNQTYLRFVLRSKEAISRLIKHLPELKGVDCASANIQPIPHALLEGEEEIILSSKSYISHLIGKIELHLGPKGFVQTNQAVSDRLYQTAARWVADLKSKRFCELYCGQGAFSFACSSSIEKGLGIEINPEAVKSANETSLKHKLNHLSFKAADAAGVEEEVSKFAPDVLLVNPPRRGLGEAVNFLKKKPAQVIIYSSCNVETLKKDLEALEGIYKCSKAQLFDMFPHTEHFETLTQLELV